MRKAHKFDPDSGEYMFDWIIVSPDENGQYDLPDNTTWDNPQKADGTAFILPIFIDGSWREGGTAPEPTPSIKPNTEQIAELLVDSAMKDSQIAGLQMQNASLLADSAAKDSRITSLQMQNASILADSAVKDSRITGVQSQNSTLLAQAAQQQLTMQDLNQKQAELLLFISMNSNNL